MTFFNTLWTALTWWQVSLVAILTVYTFIRAFFIYENGSYKSVLLGYNANSIKLYHIIWFLIDIPAAILGLFFPIIKAVFSLDVIPLRQKKK
jgi:hypothetical protein